MTKTPEYMPNHINPEEYTEKHINPTSAENAQVQPNRTDLSVEEVATSPHELSLELFLCHEEDDFGNSVWNHSKAVAIISQAIEQATSELRDQISDLEKDARLYLENAQSAQAQVKTLEAKLLTQSQVVKAAVELDRLMELMKSGSDGAYHAHGAAMDEAVKAFRSAVETYLKSQEGEG